jgi:hypothetical protein
MVFTYLSTNIKSMACSVSLGSGVDLDPDTIEQELIGSLRSRSAMIFPVLWIRIRDA